MNLSLINNILMEFLVQLHQITGNLGLSILAFTLVVRLLLVPLSLPGMKSQKKLRDLQPELNKLKAIHGKDKKALQLAQMELYKKHNINPLSGCLPQVVQIVLLIVLYQVLVAFVSKTEFNGVALNPHFFWLNLTQPDKFFILPVLAGITQLILSLMILPGAETPNLIPDDAKSKKLKEENKKEEDTAEMAAAMQKQMLFIMPIMTAFIAVRFPSGVALYWVASTVFSIIQQYFMTGWGGVTLYLKRTLNFFQMKSFTK
ncbi:membrane protein insertase YidC [Patescibacteria group bacterium]|mgnify:CR=1 FL=1|nr:membrane protein insertase YidC [Patescibacteria group bacterium]